MSAGGRGRRATLAGVRAVLAALDDHPVEPPPPASSTPREEQAALLRPVAFPETWHDRADR